MESNGIHLVKISHPLMLLMLDLTEWMTADD